MSFLFRTIDDSQDRHRLFARLGQLSGTSITTSSSSAFDNCHLAGNCCSDQSPRLVECVGDGAEAKAFYEDEGGLYQTAVQRLKLLA
jgi:hypothetical protein